MATKLDKTIKRELEHQGKIYTITISPAGVKAVEKGKRLGQEVTWDAVINGHVHAPHSESHAPHDSTSG